MSDKYRLRGLNVLASLIHDNAARHGWYDPTQVRPFDGMMMNVVAEVAEAQEEWRNGREPGQTYFKLTLDGSVDLGVQNFKHERGKLWVRNYDYDFDPRAPEWVELDLSRLRQMPGLQGSVKPEGIPTELADIIIRVLDVCAYLGIDIEDAIADKMNYNEHRPHRHGGKRS